VPTKVYTEQNEGIGPIKVEVDDGGDDKATMHIDEGIRETVPTAVPRKTSPTHQEESAKSLIHSRKRPKTEPGNIASNAGNLKQDESFAGIGCSDSEDLEQLESAPTCQICGHKNHIALQCMLGFLMTTFVVIC
jgi:hypothetical protein